MEGRMVFMQALSPVHTGTGQSVDVIDLPVAREKVTRWPFIPGSSIKGVLRDAYTDALPKQDVEKLFGPEEVENDNAAAGMLLFSDARLLCLPVRSFYGTFCFATCPAALGRLARDFRCCLGVDGFETCAEKIDFDEAVVCSDTGLTSDERQVILEDLVLKIKEGANADSVADRIARMVFDDEDDEAERAAFKPRFAVVNDDLFTELTEMGMEVAARVRIADESKTVARGALWYEEAIPTESIFWFPLLAAPRNGYNVLQPITDNWVRVVQIGGNSTVGRGIMRLVMREEA